MDCELNQTYRFSNVIIVQSVRILILLQIFSK